MFTGIINTVTQVKSSKASAKGLTITFARPSAWEDLSLGGSIATKGVCLSVSALRTTEYDCLLMPETLQKSSFGTKVPKFVNLERPMRAGDEFGGHFVQGHVDCIGMITKIDQTDGYRVTIKFPRKYLNLVAPKGSITVDGVSLTIVDINKDSFSVSLIPHTLKVTTLKDLRVGSSVNLEFDMLGKYIVKALDQRR